MKTIQGFNFNHSPLNPSGESRIFTILADDGSQFELQVVNGNKYYNFATNNFGDTEYGLKNASTSGGSLEVEVVFPATEAATKYDIHLIAHKHLDTQHAGYNEVRDGEYIDTNKSTGSNSNVLMKNLYQYLNVNLVISNSSQTGGLGSAVASTITTSKGAFTNSIPFSTTWTCLSTQSMFAINKPTKGDIVTNTQITPETTPIFVLGENVYPAVTTVASLQAAAGGTRVDATDGQEITMYVVASTLAAVGDRVTTLTLNHYLNNNIVTVTAVSDGDGKTFTLSENVSIANETALAFSNSRNKAWKFNNVEGISPGMTAFAGSFFPRNAIIKEYSQYEGLSTPRYKLKPIDTLGARRVKTRDSTTLIETAVQTGVLMFSEAAKMSFGTTNTKIFAYGPSSLKQLTGFDLDFSDLALKVTPKTTTTTTSPSASATFNVASGEGIAIGSTVRGIGIDESVASPTVTVKTNVGGATFTSGTATITLSTAQTLETGITLTFNSGSVATVSGKVKINEVGNESATLSFDVERFLEIRL